LFPTVLSAVTVAGDGDTALTVITAPSTSCSTLIDFVQGPTLSPDLVSTFV
jgi:hypothetical protein